MKKRRPETERIIEGTPLELATMDDLADQIDRIYEAIARRSYEIFEGRGRAEGHALYDWLQAESEVLHPVKIEVTEADDTLIVCAEVPGFSAHELRVGVEPRRAAIVGKKEFRGARSKKKTVYGLPRSEQIPRVLDLPVEAHPAKAKATLKGGVLELRLPRATKSAKIRVEPKVE